MLLMDEVLEENRSFEEFMNSPTDARSKCQDPRDMEGKIRAEADHLLAELRVKKALGRSLDKDRSIPVGRAGENVLYFYRKQVMRKGEKLEEYLSIRFEVLIGSPLYIALYLKRYGEAAEILEKVPDSAEPGYAALPATVRYKHVSGELSDGTNVAPEVTFHLDRAVYLQDLVLLDKDIPDDLFLALCRRLAERKESGVIDLPCRYEGRIGERNTRSKEKIPDDIVSGHWGYEDRSCQVPSLLREFADRTDLKRHYGELKHVDKNWGNRMHSEEESKTYKESVLSDEALFWKVLNGLERLKKLDEGLFCSWVDERTAAHFLVKYMFIIFNLVTSHFYIVGKRETAPQRTREMKEPIDACVRAAMLRTALKRLGYDEVPADVLWDAFTDFGYGADPSCNGFWIGLELWKLVFQKELVLELKEDVEHFGSDGADRSLELLTAMFYCKATIVADGTLDEPPYDNALEYIYPADVDQPVGSSKCFLEMVDRVQWNADGVKDQKAFLRHRHAVEKTVLGTGDKELFFMCLEKNIFPASDMAVLHDKVSEGQEDVLPLMILKRYGYL
ncbi:MAG: hypothetical protein IJ794_16445 [Lachnospiraceae bacterium]|nr:hypothetical protein [Lachnospiraceae bacterium]